MARVQASTHAVGYMLLGLFLRQRARSSSSRTLRKTPEKSVFSHCSPRFLERTHTWELISFSHGVHNISDGEYTGNIPMY